MNQRPMRFDWRHSLLTATGCALLLLALFCLLAWRSTPIAQAQGGTLSMAITKTLDGSPVVRVGEYINFTIRITNTGTISITKLPVIDNFDPKVLRFDQTNPPPSTQSDGLITWTNLPTDVVGGPLEPAGVIVIKSRFRVIGISDKTINRVRIEDALGMGGLNGGGGDDQSGSQTEGGRVVIEKALAPGQTPMVGQPITFTIAVRNDGAADLIKIPLKDIYAPAYLQFREAMPPPSKAITGELTWDDLLPAFRLSRLKPNEVITITTVFIALKPIDGATVNRAEAVGVRDEFQNELPASRQDEVPIRILPGTGENQPTATALPRPTSRPDKKTPTPETEAALATPTASAVTPTASAITPTVELSGTAGLTATVEISGSLTPTPTILAPARLPRTGSTGTGDVWLMLALALMLGGALVLLYRRAVSC